MAETEIKCDCCGMKISDPGEYPDPAAMLCNPCYENLEEHAEDYHNV